MTGKEITEIRESLGLSKSQLSRLLGVSTSTIVFWENNERSPAQIYVASLMRLREKAMGLSGVGEKKEFVDKILNFLLVGGLFAFLIWLFSDDKK